MKPAAGFKRALHHFQVTESLGFEPSGEGEHQYLFVRKCGLNTADVAQTLARRAGVKPVDVGYAGMKDKHAITEQWFSLPGEAVAAGELDEGITVLRTARHTKKLRRGQLSGNTFRVLLTDLEGPAPQDIDPVFPNYFGPQRFGGDNLDRAMAWIGDRRSRRISRSKQGLYLSVLRSHLFNAVLDRRVRDGSWREVLPGEALNDTGEPTGPLWGRGRPAATGAALELEQNALAEHAELLDALEHAGLSQARRPLAAEARDFQITGDQHQLELSFSLPAGAYATVFLGRYFRLEEQAR